MSTFAQKFSLSGFKMPDRVFDHQGPQAHRLSHGSVKTERRASGVKPYETQKWTKFGVDAHQKNLNSTDRKMERPPQLTHAEYTVADVR